LLSAEAIAARGLALAGWIANRIDPKMLCFDENVAALEKRLGAPLLGIVPHLADGDAARAATALRLPILGAGDLERPA
jgi:dethiobiotin synthetase